MISYGESMSIKMLKKKRIYKEKAISSHWGTDSNNIILNISKKGNQTSTDTWKWCEFLVLKRDWHIVEAPPKIVIKR